MNPTNVKTFGTRTIYVTADELHGALRRLGPTGDRDEGIVKVFAETLADMIEHSGVFTIRVVDKAAHIERVPE